MYCLALEGVTHDPLDFTVSGYLLTFCVKCIDFNFQTPVFIFIWRKNVWSLVGFWVLTYESHRTLALNPNQVNFRFTQTLSVSSYQQHVYVTILVSLFIALYLLFKSQIVKGCLRTTREVWGGKQLGTSPPPFKIKIIQNKWNLLMQRICVLYIYYIHVFMHSHINWCICHLPTTYWCSHLINTIWSFVYWYSHLINTNWSFVVTLITHLTCYLSTASLRKTLVKKRLSSALALHIYIGSLCLCARAKLCLTTYTCSFIY